MKIISTDNSHRRSFQIYGCTFVTDEGWSYSDHIVDQESGLVVIRVNTIEPVNVEAGKRFGWGGCHPCKHFVFDPVTKRFLSHKDWAPRFSYDLKIKTSADGKLECRMQRVYCPEQRMDEIRQELIDTCNHRLLIRSSPFAFAAEPIPCLIERWYRDKEREEERIQKELSKRSLDQDHDLELEALKNEDLLLEAKSSKGEFLRVIRRSNRFFVFLEKNGSSETIARRSNLAFVEHDMQAVFDWLTQEKDWYMHWRPGDYGNKLDNFLLRSFFIRHFNQLRFEHSFTAMNYGRINQWENYFRNGSELRDSEYRQYCPLCKGYHMFFARYPKSLCDTCRDKEVFDEDGNLVEYSRIEEDIFPKSEDRKPLGKLFIDGQRVWYCEARFGGVVVQLGDNVRNGEKVLQLAR